jgi:uncharacterized delta-60 repeat protein
MRCLVGVLLLAAGCVRVGFDVAASDASLLADVPPTDLRLDGPDARVEDLTKLDQPVLPPGSLDPSFGGKGVVVMPVSVSGADQAKAVAVDSQGRIVLGGQVESQNPGLDFYLARLAPDGTPDASFGGGLVILDLNGSHEVLDSVAVDQADRVVAGGQTQVGGDLAVGLARLLPTGVLDPAFAGDGKLALQASSGEDALRGLALDAVGRIVFSGSDPGRLLLGRVSPGGVPDGSFGTGGVIRAFEAGSSGWDLAVAPDGSLVATGRSYQGTGSKVDVAVVRVAATGQPDPGFGLNGEVLVDVGGGDDHAEGIALDATGRVVVAGRSIDGATGEIFVLRLLGDGKLDPGFGSGGIVLRAVGSDARAFDVLVDAKGRIVVVGETQQPGGVDLVILRLLPDGKPDTALGPEGRVVLDLDGRDDHTRGVVLDGQGRLLVAGWLDDTAAADSFVARLLM